MSKLPKAPLLEVIFEIKWDIINKSDIINFQYLHGDLYSKLKDEFPFRENLVPPEIPFEMVKGTPIYRFRKNEKGYPLVQIGPGLLTINTIDDVYYWESFRAEVKNTIDAFTNVFPKYDELKLSPILTYIDFFEINSENQNILDFINQNLHLNIQQDFIAENKASINDMNLTFNYQLKKDILSLNLRNGNINNNKDGIVLQTKMIGSKEVYTPESLLNWLNNAHDFCSDLFKKITKTGLYNSFK